MKRKRKIHKKAPALCDSCRWSIWTHCVGVGFNCPECTNAIKNSDGSAFCRCRTIIEGEHCPYYEKGKNND